MRAVILLTLLGSAFAVPKSINRIVGGTPTTVQAYPYMANMQYGFWGIWWFQACGGSLITSTSVLSAAHCYFGDLPSEWNVRLGTSLASSGGTLHTVSQLVIHPQYNSATINNDVAIVRLAIPATFSDIIQPASIPGTNYVLPDNTLLTTVGWGTLSSGGGSPEQLQHVDIYSINQTTCAERYAYLKTLPGFANWPDVTDKMLCAGILDVGGKDACQGDSGGPLAQTFVSEASAGNVTINVIVGIVSWGYQCAHPEYPGVNARVNKFTDWIIANA